MLKRLAAAAALIALAAAASAWLLTAPDGRASALPDHVADPTNGELVFWAGGCASCHAAPEAKGDALLVLSGGRELATDFGTFRVPNISPDPRAGIGGWSVVDFVNAVMRGVSPSGSHLYPAFPYTSYARMSREDVIDLKAFLDTLPASSNVVAGHDLPFPYSVRRGIGLWKRLYLDTVPVKDLAGSGDEVQRGQYLVEAVGHCGECHTPRNRLGGLQFGRWLAGAPNPEGRGRIPNITPSPDGIGDWSASDIAYVLETGTTPDFDSFSGRMAEVSSNLAHLPESDRAAIAAYLKAIPPLPDGE